MFCDPPVAGTVAVSGVTPKVHPVSCVIVNVCPAAVIVPDRAAAVFAAALNCTVPLPVPLAPDVIVIHGAFAAAVHEQEPLPTTLNEPPPPPAGTDCPGADSTRVQPLDWLMVNVWPAMVAVPVRAASVFASTVTCTVPLPDPLPADRWIHGALLVAVQLQPAPPVTVTAIGVPPVPPLPTF
jgi:hypothetical protein